MTARVLVAGVGNIFFGDDGFGCEVMRALQNEHVEGARVEDFGIAGLHLGYELLNGYEHAIIVDLAARGGTPGTLYVIEPDVQRLGGFVERSRDGPISPAETNPPGPPPDAHRMDLQNVFAFVRALGGEAPPVEIIGCEPQTLDEGIGLSESVAASVEPAVALVRKLIARALSAPPHRKGETTCLEA